MKRLILCAVFIAFILSGCKPSNGNDNQSSADTEPSTTAAAPEQTAELPQTAETSQSAASVNAAGNTPGNLLQRGIAVSDGVYDYLKFFSGNWGLFKLEKGSSVLTERVLYISDSDEGFNIADGYVYCQPRRKSALDINDHGSRISETMPATSYLAVVGDWVYYVPVNEDVIMRVKTDGTQEETIVDEEIDSLDNGVSNVNVFDGWVYYAQGSNSDKLYKANAETGEKVFLAHSKELWDNPYARFGEVNVSDGWIYLNGITLIKMRTDGSEIETLFSGAEGVASASRINVNGDWVYFCNGQEIYRLKTDASELEYICKSPFEIRCMNVIDDSIYLYVYAYSHNQFWRVYAGGGEPELITVSE